MSKAAASIDRSDRMEKRALLRFDWFSGGLSVEKRLLLFGIAVEMLAHVFYWFFLFSRLRPFRDSLLQLPVEALGWDTRLWLGAPWLLQVCSVIFSLAAVWTWLKVKGQAATVMLFILFSMLLAELVFLFSAMLSASSESSGLGAAIKM
jgi:hypothetical protein